MIEYKEVKNIKEFAEFADAIWHEYWICILSSEQIDYMADKFQSEDAVKKQIETENYKYFYIVQDNTKAGYFGLSKRKDYLFLSKLYLKKEFRHLGLGTKAFDFIKNYAKSSHYKYIELTVNKYNTNTINAYKKWGFNITNSVVTDIGNNFVMDDYIMCYSLD